MREIDGRNFIEAVDFSDPDGEARFHQMRIRPVSDIHLDFYRGSTAPWLDPSDDYDVLAVLGDISNPVMAGIEAIAREVDRIKKPCVYVSGNHDGYRGMPGRPFEFTFWEEQMSMLEEFGSQNGITVLNRRVVVIGNTRFAGVVGWGEFASELVPPNMTKGDAMSFSSKGWAFDCPGDRVQPHNDFREIRVGKGNSRHRLTPAQMIEWAMGDNTFLRNALAQPFDGDTVVVTHIGPASLVAPGMHSWLYGSRANEDLICAPDSGVSCWLSGHTHKTFDVEVGGVRCVSNARGYPNENPDFDPSLVIEVGPSLTPKLGM